MIMKTLNSIKKNRGGFTLIELVMTILLIGILSIGLYEVVIWGISDYVTNERYLHSNNSMTYAMMTIRRNMAGAVMPPIPPQTFSVLGACPFKLADEPSQTNPICIFSSFNIGAGCNTQGVGNEISFLQLNQKTSNYELIVYCVVNNILYKEVNSNVLSTSYPVANNISGIIF